MVLEQAYVGICFKLYQFVLHFIFIPLIKRYFDGLIRDTQESLCVFLPDVNCKLYFGASQQAFASSETLPVTLFLQHPITFYLRILADPKIGLGEAYMYGDWDVKPKPQDFLGLLIRAKRYNASRKTNNSYLWYKNLFSLLVQLSVKLIQTTVSFINVMQHQSHANSLLGSSRNIRKHYDLGNNMFSLFLDPSMTYSCAIFEVLRDEILHSDAKLLEEAQMRKYDKIFAEINLKPNDRVLEIGCGWGACGIRAAQRYGCQWTGLTISREQLKIAQQKVDENDLQENVKIKLLDYRLEEDVYDKVIAIEMIEAVGHEYLSQFFGTLRDRLRPGGKAYLQAITCPDAYYEHYRRTSDFIRKHIFPGGHLPSERAIQEALPQELAIKKTIHIGHHYVTTLDLWYCAWMEHEEEVLMCGYSRQFHRKWQFYFALCSTLFRYSHIDTVQILIEKST